MSSRRSGRHERLAVAPAPAAELVVVPALRVTSYEQTAAGVLAVFLGLAALAVGIVVIYYASQKPPKVLAVPVEIVELPGGYEDGAPDETLRVDSPLPESPNAAPVDAPSDTQELTEQLGSVAEFSEAATEQLAPQQASGEVNRGTPGSARGTGRRPLGSGGGRGGYPREQRWFVRFGERVPVDEYARQLQFFQIELGALLPDGRIAYLSDITAARPTLRFIERGSSEKRLYMTWQGGERRFADRELFKRAGFEMPDGATAMHFYPPETENVLAQLELAYRGRKVSQIRRTYYAVESEGSGYRFVVTRQTYHDDKR